LYELVAATSGKRKRWSPLQHRQRAEQNVPTSIAEPHQQTRQALPQQQQQEQLTPKVRPC
jgi:hypothetical protein